MEKKYTPDNITELKENEVFVFGSNMHGNHAGGAAYMAVQKFGAKMGNPEGIQGQSYAIPTLDQDGNRINLTDLEGSIKRFYQYAEAHPGNTFYLTKIGCGIAGYEVSDIATVVNCQDIPENVIIPEEFTHIPGFKGFDENLKCRGFQYEVGKDYHEEGKIETCESGFHFCQYPLDVFSYYPPAGNRFCSVSGSGSASFDGGDSKVAVSDLKVKAEIGIAGLVKAAIEYTKKRCTNKHNADKGKPATAGYSGAATAGDRGAATAGDRGAATAGYSGAATAGDYGAATAGDRGAATAGDRGAATAGYSGAATAGDYGAATAGDRGAATAGDRGAATAGYSGAATAGDSGAATAGDYGAATAGNSGVATSRGSSSVGENGLAVARGNGAKVKGGLGSILVIAEEEEDDYIIQSWKAVIVDGTNIKPDTWYSIVDGELKEV